MVHFMMKSIWSTLEKAYESIWKAGRSYQKEDLSKRCKKTRFMKGKRRWIDIL
jgi:hypothetical protein